MRCLNCGIEMMNNQVSTKNDLISYDMCEKCGSLWLDEGELDKMAFQVEGSIEYCSQEPVVVARAADTEVPSMQQLQFVSSAISELYGYYPQPL